MGGKMAVKKAVAKEEKTRKGRRVRRRKVRSNVVRKERRSFGKRKRKKKAKRDGREE